MIQDRVVHWRQFTEGVYKYLVGNLQMAGSCP